MIQNLSSKSSEIIRACLRATVEGPFFPEWEFSILFGVDRETVRKVYEDWPNQYICDEDFILSVLGSMNHLLGYPHGEDEAWDEYIPATTNEVISALSEVSYLKDKLVY